MEKTYKGWEIAKMISDGNLEEGTILTDEHCDKFIIKNNCLYYFNPLEEAHCSYLTSGEYAIERKKYTFTEAFKALDDGKEIETYRGAHIKKINGVTMVLDICLDKWFRLSSITVDAIENPWFINEV